MSSVAHHTRRVVLASRPVGEPTAENFRFEEAALPPLKDGEVLLKTRFLSLDPYMRGRMSDAPSYAAPVEVDEVMVGGTVSQVEESRDPAFKPGDWVLGMSGWQSHDVVSARGLRNLGEQPEHPSLMLGVLGMPGFTGYMGLLDIGQPKAGETVVVAAASGPVGSVVGQVAKLKGCRVIGIAGGEKKCRYVRETLGFDDCLDHRGADLPQRLAQACPKGIDVYYENVGGAVFDAVLPLLNSKARIPVCGIIAQYNATGLPPGPDRLPLLEGLILTKRIRMEGFIIFDDYAHRYDEFLQQMQPWVKEGKIRFQEDVVDGLDQAPQAFIDMLNGGNFGKLVVKL